MKILPRNPILSNSSLMVFIDYNLLNLKDSGVDDKIPLPNVNIKNLKKVLDYCIYHKKDDPPEIEKPLKSNNLADAVCQWDVDYMNIEKIEEIFELISAANYLDIKSLMELACAKIATLIKGSFYNKYN